MIKVVTATEAKNRFGELIKQVYLGEEHLIVKRGDIPVVAIVSIADYEHFISPQDLPGEIARTVATGTEEERASRRLLAFLDQIHRKLPDVPEEEAEQEIQEAVQAVRTIK